MARTGATPAAALVGQRRIERLHRVWGERIREERIAFGWTQTDLAERVGMTQGEISRIEHGERGIADLDRINIAEALDVSPGWLFDYEADEDEVAS